MPHLKYPPGIITAWERSKDRTHTTLIQHSLNEALKQRGGVLAGDADADDGTGTGTGGGGGRYLRGQ